jgi:hypothetical protein
MKSIFDFKKMKRNENIVSFIKPIFTWRLLYISVIMVFLYNLGNVVFSSSSMSVCGDMKSVWKEEGCGCSDDEMWDYYAYVISEDKEVHSVTITKEKYDDFLAKDGDYFCGEEFVSNYYWCLALAILLGIILIAWTITINENDSWTYKQ